MKLFVVFFQFSFSCFTKNLKKLFSQKIVHFIWFYTLLCIKYYFIIYSKIIIWLTRSLFSKMVAYFKDQSIVSDRKSAIFDLQKPSWKMIIYDFFLLLPGTPELFPAISPWPHLAFHSAFKYLYFIMILIWKTILHASHIRNGWRLLK